MIWCNYDMQDIVEPGYLGYTGTRVSWIYWNYDMYDMAELGYLVSGGL